MALINFTQQGADLLKKKGVPLPLGSRVASLPTSPQPTAPSLLPTPSVVDKLATKPITAIEPNPIAPTIPNTTQPSIATQAQPSPAPAPMLGQTQPTPVEEDTLDISEFSLEEKLALRNMIRDLQFSKFGAVVNKS